MLPQITIQIIILYIRQCTYRYSKDLLFLFNLLHLKMQQTINACADKLAEKLISLSESKESIAMGV